MSKITCDICLDLLPLVRDEVASNDSKNAVLEHILTCEECRVLYTENELPAIDPEKITSKIKKKLFYFSLSLIVLGVVLGASIGAGQFMFYNIILMPVIGAIAYCTLKGKCYYSLIFVFATVYLRWLFDSFGYALHGELLNAFIAPLWWALIYTGLSAFGVIIAFLFHFGFRKERRHEKND